MIIATLYVACTDPPNLGDDASAGTGGTTGGTGAKGGSSTGGSNGGSTAAKGGSAGSGGGSSGSSGSSGNGGAGAQGSGGGTDQAEGGMSAGMAGEAGQAGQTGATGGVSGEAGAQAVSGQGGAGEGGAGPVDACSTAIVGGKSIMKAPGTSGVAQPSGTPGNLKVVDWAGFKGAISFTFDDNLSSMIANYPNLAAVGVPLTFYLVCSTEGSNQVWHDAVAAGHEIGNHTMHHCNVDGSRCGWGAFTDPATELDQCTTQLMSEYGLPAIYSMAAPNGDTNWEPYARTRFLLNRGVDDTAGIKPNDNSDPYHLPCHISNGPDPNTSGPDSSSEKAVGGFNDITDSTVTNGVWKTILMHSFGADYGYHPVDINEAVAALTYARDLGTVWVDTVTAIGAYWRAQKVVSTAAPKTSGSDITYSWTLPDHFPPNMYLRVTVDGGTVKQCGQELTWDDHGYYEIALDAGSVTISP